MKKLFYLTAALVAAVVVFSIATRPPRRLTLRAADDGTLAGILHVHTNRSDGLSSPDEIAAAAARAGLRFVVFTDHGDATRTPDPPVYRSGVLCLDGVEISTSGGHYLAIDMPASPYPLGGEARDVVEDVRRLGGFGIVAHPDSPKPELRWTDWTVPFDGVEVLNPDTGWRVLASQAGWPPKQRLLSALLSYPVRSPEAIASLIQPSGALAPWEAVARQRRVVMTGGADAHAKLAPRNADPGDSRFALPIPGYEQSFRAMSVRLRVERPLSGNAAADAGVVTRAIRNGHLHVAVDGIASPPSLDFTATNARGTVHEGDVLNVGGALEIRIQSNAPPVFTTVVHDGLRTISTVRDTNDLTVHAPEAAGIYWVEIISNTGAPPVTWLRSNPIYVRNLQADAPLPRSVVQAATAARPLFTGGSTEGFRLEHDPNSVGAVDAAPNVSTPTLRYRFGLAGGAALGQFTALVHDLPAGAAGFDRVRFTIRAEQPMRISLQVRDTTADRWQRSVYVDTSEQERTVGFDDLRPVGVTHVPMPSADALRSLMFVVDTTNTKPGTSGRVWIGGLALQR